MPLVHAYQTYRGGGGEVDEGRHGQVGASAGRHMRHARTHVVCVPVFWGAMVVDAVYDS